MSAAFFNKNSKLSSSDFTRMRGFRNRFYFDICGNGNTRTKTINSFNTSENYIQRINNFNDYNFIKNQFEITQCISSNIVCNNYINNTAGEIYLGNYIVELSLNNVSNCRSGHLFNYSISGNIIDYNFKTLCLTDCSSSII